MIYNAYLFYSANDVHYRIYFRPCLSRRFTRKNVSVLCPISKNSRNEFVKFLNFVFLKRFSSAQDGDFWLEMSLKRKKIYPGIAL